MTVPLPLYRTTTDYGDIYYFTLMYSSGDMKMGTGTLELYPTMKMPLLANGAEGDGSAGNYRSIEDSRDPSIVYCIHGNLYSVCCRDVEAETGRGAGEGLGISSGGGEGGHKIGADHCHQERNAGVDKRARRKLIIASLLCLVFMVGEVIGGVMANSLAIATDAAHLLTDFASFMISLFSLWVATKPATRRMSFGWYRAEVIGALTSVLMIWVVTGILVYMAFERVFKNDFEIDAEIMLITSGVGVAVNIFMALTLHQHSHGHHHHDHGDGGHHDHDHHGHDQRNINVRAAFIHVIGDFIQSIGVFTAALVIYFKPEWHLVDPICTFLFSILVLLTTFAIMKDTLTVLMEGKPKGIDFADVEKSFLSIDGVLYVHNLRIWALSMDKAALSAHLAIEPGKDPLQILEVASRLMRSKYAFFEMTLQIEHYKAAMDDCSQCQPPKK